MNDAARLLFPRTLTALAALGVAAPAAAHHALEAMYDTSAEVVTTATLNRVDWINPHAWMRFDVRYPDGHVENDVMVETLSISNLRLVGIDKAALVMGGQYEITYYPTRDGSPGGFMTRMVLPGGSQIAAPANVPDDSNP